MNADAALLSPAAAPLVEPPVIPPAPAPWTEPRPLWRTLLQIRRNALPTWGPIAYREEVLAGRFLGRGSLLLNAPDAIRRVLVDNHENYGRTPATIRILHPMIGDGLFLSEGERWRRQRRVTAPAFAPRSLGIVARVAARRTDESLDRLAAEGRHVVDLLGLFQRLALEVAGEALFSQTMAPYAGEMRRHLDRYGRSFARPSPLDFVAPRRLPTPLGLARRWFSRGWFGLVERILEDRRAHGVADPPKDLFDILATARDPETGEGFARAELRDQVATLVIAGHETTALALFWASYLLALAPAVQERVAEEAAGLDPARLEGPPDERALPLTRAVLQEALRLYPPAFTIVREARGPDEVAGHAVEPGSLVIVAPWVLHRHRKRWREPERFDPGRFLPGAPPVDRYAFLPFGVGPRVCIGAQFALVEATLVLALLCRRHRLEIVGSKRVMPVGVVTVYPERAPAFRLRPR